MTPALLGLALALSTAPAGLLERSLAAAAAAGRPAADDALVHVSAEDDSLRATLAGATVEGHLALALPPPSAAPAPPPAELAGAASP